MYCKLRGKASALFDAVVCELSDILAINSGGVVMLEEVRFLPACILYVAFDKCYLRFREMQKSTTSGQVLCSRR